MQEHMVSNITVTSEPIPFVPVNSVRVIQIILRISVEKVTC